MDSARLIVKVVPGAHRDEVVGRHGEGVRVRVSAPPEKGRANAAVVALIAAALGVAARDVAVRRGLTGPLKMLEIAGVSRETIEKWLAGGCPTASARAVGSRGKNGVAGDHGKDGLGDG